MKTDHLRTINLYLLTIISLIILALSACNRTVKTPEKLISDRTAVMMDNYLKNRTESQVPIDDRLVFGYTYNELEEYMTYLKDIANKKQVSLDSIKFVIAAYPPNPDRDHKVYTAIYLKPTFKGDIDNSNINKAQIGTVSSEEKPEEEEEYKTILDMSGCCPSDEFIASEK